MDKGISSPHRLIDIDLIDIDIPSSPFLFFYEDTWGIPWALSPPFERNKLQVPDGTLSQINSQGAIKETYQSYLPRHDCTVKYSWLSRLKSGASELAMEETSS